MNMIMPKTTKTELGQGGFASIVVALVMILVLALLTVGFAQLARREQQNALFNQLSNQAYYAAESGINDVIKGIKNGTIHSDDRPGNPKTPNINTKKCLGAPLTDGPADNPGNVISKDTDVSYTCAIVDLNPPFLPWSGVDDRSSRNIMFTTTSGILNEMTVSWGSADGHDTPRPSGGKSLTPQGGWGNSPAVVQINITPLGNNTGVVNRAAVMNNTFTAYLYPSTDAGAITYVANSGLPDDPIVAGNCQMAAGKLTGTYPCRVTISGLKNHPGAVASELYLVHFVVYYDSTNLVIHTLKDENNNTVGTKDGLAIIDVTGKAKNVLKRLQVSYPLRATAAKPTDAIESQSACKQFDTDPIQGTQYKKGYLGIGSEACDFNSP